MERSFHNIWPNGEKELAEEQKAAVKTQIAAYLQSKKQRELSEWDHIELDHYGGTTIRSVNSLAPKDLYFAVENCPGLSRVDEPFHIVEHAGTRAKK